MLNLPAELLAWLPLSDLAPMGILEEDGQLAWSRDPRRPTGFLPT